MSAAAAAAAAAAASRAAAAVTTAGGTAAFISSANKRRDEFRPAALPRFSRYDSLKRRDWNTFCLYLMNHHPSLTISRCGGEIVLEFLRYLDRFGETKVHFETCAYFGDSYPRGPCPCPLKQASDAVYGIVGRLRVAFEENGGGSPEMNPFRARAVAAYLREVRDAQARATGIGSAICLHEFLELRLRDVQWNTSVSMAKFTSQEVDALQSGGNQRARDIYLQNWDFQRQRLPDSSNVDKIREFIRNVYVERRYAVSKSSDKSPRDIQSSRIHEDDTRRASSYHSYSQSPPYDHQYEDWRYGKQVAALTRKPGSDKVRYEGKMSSIIYSPGCFSDYTCDEGFAGKGSGPRISDFSASNGGEQFKFDVEFRSREDVWSNFTNTSLETNHKKDADGIHCLERTTSPESTDSNLASVSSDPSKAPVATEPFSSSASPVDLFQLPTAPSQATLVDLFQPSISAAPSIDFSMNFSQQPSVMISNEKPLELSVPKNEGWATFDTPQHTPPSAQVEISAALPSTADSLPERFDPFSNISANRQSPSSETSTTSVPSSVTYNLWHDGAWNGEKQISFTASNSQEEVQPHEINCKSTNPFDYPYDSDVEHNNMYQLQFLDISSLQVALPDPELPPAYHTAVAEPWLPQNILNPYLSSPIQGGLTFLAAQPPSSQILIVQTQELIASSGGNPFA